MDIYSEKLLKENNLLKSKIQEIYLSIEELKKKIELEKAKRDIDNTVKDINKNNQDLSNSIEADYYGNKD